MNDILSTASETIGDLAGRAVNTYKARPAVVIATATAAVAGLAFVIGACARK